MRVAAGVLNISFLSLSLYLSFVLFLSRSLYLFLPYNSPIFRLNERSSPSRLSHLSGKHPRR